MLAKEEAIEHLKFEPGSELLSRASAAPLRRFSPFSLAASPGVLVLLDIVTGLELNANANTEAVMGLLAELKVEGGSLRGLSGKTVAVEACLGFLARLGANTGDPLSVRDSLELCELIGIISGRPAGLTAYMRNLIHGSAERLDRCIRTLEGRGYRVRQSNRLFTTCHIVPQVNIQPVVETGRLFSRPILPDDLTLAA